MCFLYVFLLSIFFRKKIMKRLDITVLKKVLSVKKNCFRTLDVIKMKEPIVFLTQRLQPTFINNCWFIVPVERQRTVTGNGMHIVDLFPCYRCDCFHCAHHALCNLLPLLELLAYRFQTEATKRYFIYYFRSEWPSRLSTNLKEISRIFVVSSVLEIS